MSAPEAATTAPAPASAPAASAAPAPPPALTLTSISDADERTLADTTPSPTALTHPEYIEQLFCKIEREAELRAEAEAAADRSKRLSSTPSVSGPGSRPDSADSGARGRRRGGSVSVSRFGAPIDANGDPVPGTPSRLSALALQNPMYQHAAIAAAAASSRETIASSLGTDAPAADDEHTVTQVQRIPGRSRSATLTKAVGAAIGRRLSRATSRDVLADVPVVVGVVVSSDVTEAVVEPAPTESAAAIPAEAEAGGSPASSQFSQPQVTTTITVVSAEAGAPARPPLKRDRSKLSAWADKLVRKLRRRSGEDMRAAAVASVGA